MTMRAKLFENGRSQAVRLPKEYRFEGDEVRINKIGDIVILVPINFLITFSDLCLMIKIQIFVSNIYLIILLFYLQSAQLFHQKGNHRKTYRQPS